jgi:hypothetical protein
MMERLSGTIKNPSQQLPCRTGPDDETFHHPQITGLNPENQVKQRRFSDLYS